MVSSHEFNQKATKLLDLVLENKSDTFKRQVYEIVYVYKVDPDDPMFLILVATGRLEVMMTNFPQHLERLLREIKSSHESQLAQVKNLLEQVGRLTASQIGQAGSAATSAIAEANAEVLSQSRGTAREVELLHSEITGLIVGMGEERVANENVLRSLLEQEGQSLAALERVTETIDDSYTALQKLQRDLMLASLVKWAAPMTALIVVFLVGIGTGWWPMWLKYTESNDVLGRNLVQWNIDRILKCQDDHNPKCTIWIVLPPEKR